MSSTNKTSNYQLNQWVSTDPVLMADFNADNSKIDAALATLQTSRLKISTGSYAGNGTFGQSHANTLSFSFQPKIIFIGSGMDNSGDLYLFDRVNVWLRGMPSGTAYESPTQMFNVKLTWSGNSVSWYYTGNDSSGPVYQLNYPSYTYYYVAIGS